MLSAPKPWLKIASLSDVGRKRPHNEDSTGCDLRTGLVVLADGMGGYEAGELASILAVAHVISRMRRLGMLRRSMGMLSKTEQPGFRGGLCRSSRFLRESIILANREICRLARSKKSYKGMGTTLVAALFHEAHRVTVAHVGDSRLYRLRGPSFEQVTRDHSLLEDLVERGLCSREEAQDLPNKHLVTRALGKGAEVKVTVQEVAAEPDDVYLLCSDGLTDLVSDEQIHLTLDRFNGKLEDVGRGLVAQANEAGGRDNISVILAQILPIPGNSPGDSGARPVGTGA